MIREHFPSLWMAVRICGSGCFLLGFGCLIAAMLNDQRQTTN